MGANDGGCINIFGEGADLALLNRPNVRPFRNCFASGCLDSHAESPQNNHLLPLREELSRLKLHNILNLGYGREELRAPFPALPRSGKRHLFHRG